MRAVPVLLVLVLAAGDLAAQRRSATYMTPPAKDPAGVLAREVIWGVKGGLISSGTGWIDNDIEVEIDAGYSLSGFVDYRLGPKIFGTAALNITSLSGGGDGEALKDITVMIKALVGGGPTAQFAFRPAFGVGYGSDGDFTYMMLHGFVEMLPLRTSAPWVFDVGMITAPMGGDDDYDVALEPRLVLRFGRLF